MNKSNYTQIKELNTSNTQDDEDSISNASSYGSASSNRLDELAANQTKPTPSPPPPPRPTPQSRTVLKYSDKNNRYLFDQLQHDQPLQVANSLELHYHVFHNDIKKVREYIARVKRTSPKSLVECLSFKDLHENTPLHLSCMLGNSEITKLLIDEGAIVKSRNKQMWTPLNEAISYGERELIKCTLKKFEAEVEKIMEDTKPKVIEALVEMDDFYVEILWDFVSWIPFISRFLPSDVCKLHKLGSKLRLDCTLGDIAQGNKRNPDGTMSKNSESAANTVGATISPFNWERGDLTFLFDIEKIGTKDSIVFMNNARKTFTIIDKNAQVEFEHDLDKETDLMLSKEMVFLKLNTKQASFVPTQVGWFSKRDKIEVVNGYSCQFYDVNNLYIVTKLRVEHLSDEELKKREEKEAKLRQQLNQQKMTSDDMTGIEQVDLEEIKHRPSLPPPPAHAATWNDYINSKEGEWPCLGRKIKCKESKKEFKAQLAMSQEFPLTVNDLNKLLDALVPLAKFRKLKEFINLKLPPGFPVKIDIPIVPAISAKVCFQNFRKQQPAKCLFEVPKDYKEEIIVDIKEQNETVTSSY